MDTAAHGVIYFSLGTVFDCKAGIPTSVKRDLVKMFGELKQTVIWKCDGQDLEDIPKNLFLLKWAPQTSILSKYLLNIYLRFGTFYDTSVTTLMGSIIRVNLRYIYI